MKDFQEQLQKLELAVSECELIAGLATDKQKRASFERLARQYRAIWEELKTEIGNQ